MVPYRYYLLQHADSIRILVLHGSSNSSDPIKCTIQHARLSDASLKYEAVSYAWGDTSHLEPVYFHDGRRELEVGRNCHSVLENLRQKGHDRLLWIDAICINQGNLVERASQVCIMDNIYRRAFNVVVHLGEETAGSRVLFEELAEADNCDQRPPPSDIIIRELDILFQRPWFHRVWVLQEVYMKGSVTFMCGSACASAQALTDCTFGYKRCLVTKNRCPLALILVKNETPDILTAQLSLWSLLYMSRACLATDPRDRVFALKSLIGRRQSDMDALINYTTSVEETFIETAMFLLPVLGLRILTAIRHSHDLNMPSWIPDWSQHLPLYYAVFDDVYIQDMLEPNYSDEPRYSIRSPSHSEDNCLELNVKGARYAQIVHRSKRFSFNSLDDAEAQMKGLYHDLDNLRKLLGWEGTRDDSIIHNQLGREILERTYTDCTKSSKLYLLR
ncbi:HET-domain-containing protein [Pleomassaria siparia CBS 279.74]|uniref:HET-domain-containing protein n=1 Tax=Pleomassaria siparia CBS 279.74 TaxID=1314801 RepID=A0A6G1K997_9PLEO|nr:HET-domain-containing protein [Pleomassaria siparia CBS 279.74]